MPLWRKLHKREALEAPIQSEAEEATKSPEQAEAPLQSEASAEADPPEHTEAPLQSEASAEAEPPEHTEAPLQSEAAKAESVEQPLEQAEAPLQSKAEEGESPEQAEAECTYEVRVRRVAVRAGPSMDDDVILLLHKHERICGVRVEVGGNPWLRLSQATLQSHPQASVLSEETAWVLIDATYTTLGLGVLLERAPAELGWCAPTGAERSDVWEVVGKKGVQVSYEKDLSSMLNRHELAVGSLVKTLEVDHEAGRLHYSLIAGDGPDDGWVSLYHLVKVSHRVAVQQPAEEAVEPPPQDLAQAEQVLQEYGRQFMRKPEASDMIIWQREAFPWRPEASSDSASNESELHEQLARELAPQVPKAAPEAEAAKPAEEEPDIFAHSELKEMRCSFCQLPLGDICYDRNGKRGSCKDEDLIHAECMAQVLLQDMKSDEQNRLQNEQLMKRKRRQEYAIGWNAQRVPRNSAAAAKVAGCAVPEGLCALRLLENQRVAVVPTACPAAAVNLEYLSIALTVRFEEGTEPVFSLDPVDPDVKHTMQVKRFEPHWLKNTCVGDVLFDADYHLKELSLGEYEQPVVGMKSCFDFSDEEGPGAEWAAREWFVVRRPEVQLSEDGVLIPVCRMAVEAREQTVKDGQLEDTLVTRPNHPLVRYAEAFTHYFDLIAERKSVIFHLRELAKASILAKYLDESGADLEDILFELHQCKEDDNCILEVPQLWNERASSLIHVNDGQIADEHSRGASLRAVYGGVQFGLNKLRFPSMGASGVISARRSLVTPSGMISARRSFAGRAPMTGRRGFVAPGAALSARPGFFVAPSRFSFQTLSAAPALRGVDLKLDRFRLSHTVPTVRTEPIALGEDLSSCVRLGGKAFWPQLEKQDSVLGEEDRKLLQEVFNPKMSDRRMEGDLFTPPDTGYAYGTKLRSLLREEQEVRQKRKDHFFSAAFVVGAPGPLFPSSWVSEFEIARGRTPKRVPPMELGQLQARPDYLAQKGQIQQALTASTPVFEQSTEEGLSWRIYRLGSLEVRTLKPPDGPEEIGAVFSLNGAPKDKEVQAPSTAASNGPVDETEKVDKVTLCVEGDLQDPDPLGCRYFVLAETDKGNIIVTEKLKDGEVTWEENPRFAEDRLSLARVLHVQAGLAAREDCATVHSLQIYKASRIVAKASRSARWRYAEGVFNRVASKKREPVVPFAEFAARHYPKLYKLLGLNSKGEDAKAEDESS